MRMMVLVTICLMLASLSGCGRILSPPQDKAALQVIADLQTVNDPSVKPNIFTRDANRALANEMRLAMGIELSELPTSRVPLIKFQEDSASAGKTLTEVSQSAPVPESTIAMLASGGVVSLMLLLGVSVKLAKGTPLGGPLEIIQTLLTTVNPKDTHLADAFVSATEKYKASDPNWENNPLMKQIGKTLTDPLKDHIKYKIAKL